MNRTPTSQDQTWASRAGRPVILRLTRPRRRSRHRSEGHRLSSQTSAWRQSRVGSMGGHGNFQYRAYTLAPGTRAANRNSEAPPSREEKRLGAETTAKWNYLFTSLAHARPGGAGYSRSPTTSPIRGYKVTPYSFPEPLGLAAAGEGFARPQRAGANPGRPDPASPSSTCDTSRAPGRQQASPGDLSTPLRLPVIPEAGLSGSGRPSAERAMPGLPRVWSCGRRPGLQGDILRSWPRSKTAAGPDLGADVLADLAKLFYSKTGERLPNPAGHREHVVRRLHVERPAPHHRAVFLARIAG